MICNKIIPNRLKELIKERGRTMAYFNRLLNKNRSYLSNVMTGSDRISDDDIKIIADELDTTPEYLKGETDVKEKPHVGDKRQDSLNRTIGEISHLIEKQKSPNAEAEGLENERALIEEAISMLSESRKRQLLEYARFLAAQEAADHKDDR